VITPLSRRFEENNVDVRDHPAPRGKPRVCARHVYVMIFVLDFIIILKSGVN